MKNAPALFQFENQSINVITDGNGEPWFSANELCDVLGYGNSRQAIETHVDSDDVQKLDAIDSMGRNQMANHINESGMYALIFGSTKESSKRFKKWVTSEVLPSIRKTGSYTAQGATPNVTKRSIDAATAFIRNAARDLNLAQSSVLSMYQKLEGKVGLVGLLPAYAVDAPSTAGAGSSEPTKSLVELLVMHKAGLSAIAFNKRLVQLGFLAENERPSTHGVKKFKTITNLNYGKNLTSPNNPKETQPHWYVSKFQELLDLVQPVDEFLA